MPDADRGCSASNPTITALPTINARFPGYRLPGDFAGLFQPDGGFVLSECAIVAQATMAMAAGATIHARERVIEWSPIAGGGVRVKTDRGSCEAGRLVLSPGAWTGDLAPALKTLAVPERQVLGWFQPAEPAKFAPAAFPVLNLMAPEGRYYLLPVHGVPGLKIGLCHHSLAADRLDKRRRSSHHLSDTSPCPCPRPGAPSSRAPQTLTIPPGR